MGREHIFHRASGVRGRTPVFVGTRVPLEIIHKEKQVRAAAKHER